MSCTFLYHCRNYVKYSNATLVKAIECLYVFLETLWTRVLKPYFDENPDLNPDTNSDLANDLPSMKQMQHKFDCMYSWLKNEW